MDKLTANEIAIAINKPVERAQEIIAGYKILYHAGPDKSDLPYIISSELKRDKINQGKED